MNPIPEQPEVMVPISVVQKLIAQKMAPLADYRVLPRMLLTDAIRDIEFELAHWVELENRRNLEAQPGGRCPSCEEHW